MGLNEFTMVEELASLIRDNLPCKHLVLSVEEALVDFLQYDTSLDGVLELQPMSSYNRLLLHRLADIFGFSHESVGEGDERHLVLERCPETSIPSILVSDILGQYEEFQTPKILEVLEKKKEDVPGLNPEILKFDLSLEEREAAYLAARKRIFSIGECTTGETVKQRPQNNPMVARRMIAHALGRRMKPADYEISLANSEALGAQALGQRMKPADYEISLMNSEALGAQAKNVRIQNDKEDASNSGMHKKHLNSLGNMKGSSLSDSGSSNSGRKIPLEKIDKTSKLGPSCMERNEIKISKNNFREEHVGAAKRMFVNALGFHPRNGNLSRSSQTNETRTKLKLVP